MAHNSLPNCLTEVCNGIICYIEKQGKVSIEEIMEHIPGPDFPLGGTVINAKDIKTAFSTGKSHVSLKVQGDYIIEGNKIIFTSIPYRTYRNKIKEQINNNIEEFEKFLEDFNDESNVGQNRLVFTVKSENMLYSALNKIFALTDLQTTLSYNMNFIVNGTPKLCSLIDLIKYYVQHQEDVLLKATAFDKDKAVKRLHILKGLIIAIDKIDEVITLIKQSEDKTSARDKIKKLLGVDSIQADAILDMKLAKLTHIDKNELIQEKEEKENFIAECNKIIENKEYRDSILINMVINLRDKYGDKRRTILTNKEISKEEKEIAYVEPEKCVVVLTEAGTIKRIPVTSFRAQKRNGKGVKTQEEITSMVIRTNTVDNLMVFSNKGQMYRLLVNDIPVGTNTSKGASVKALVSMAADEEPTTMYSIYRDTDAKYVFFATKNGIVKKTALSEYIDTKKKSGIGAIKLREGDELANVVIMKDEPIILVTKQGYVLRFDSKEIGTTSRMTTGVKGINLGEGDELIAALPVRNQNDALALFSKHGLGKKILPKEVVTQKRGGKGLCCYKVNDSTGEVTAATLVSDEDTVLLIGDKNSICITATDIPALGRVTIGNQMIKTGKVITVSKV